MSLCLKSQTAMKHSIYVVRRLVQYNYLILLLHKERQQVLVAPYLLSGHDDVEDEEGEDEEGKEDEEN